MVVTCGKPLQASTPIILNITFDECLQTCWADSNCVVIYDTTPTCSYYSIELITTVQKLPKSSGKRVAFRLLMRNKTCSNEDNEPILRDGTVKSDVLQGYEKYTVNKYVPYNITLKNDVWTFSPRDPPYFCFPPLIPIRRNNVIWCMGLLSSSDCINRTQAADVCQKSFQQPLAGPANAAEYEYIQTTGMNFMNNPSPGSVPSGYSMLGFWLDGTRKPDCYYPQKAGADCSENNAFSFLDTNAQKPFLNWLPDQPDGLWRQSNADCVYFVARNGYAIGIDDMTCSIRIYPEMSLCMVGYYCGSLLGPDTWT
ncbi:hypothetical protein CRE_18791 [Caenorhabditis remanei]|uniref:PAN-3 domain-containing protein n=1 Tax=Caenorhabditis remanei TaxID=31234 RepID=E3LKC1_CAERE|nr:hypothetical protein CRE_18791 [Caenorhabditis remanei]